MNNRELVESDFVRLYKYRRATKSIFRYVKRIALIGFSVSFILALFILYVFNNIYLFFIVLFFPTLIGITAYLFSMYVSRYEIKRWVLADSKIKMQNGFYMPWNSIVQYEIRKMDEHGKCWKVTVANKGGITASILTDSSAGIEYIKGRLNETSEP